MAKPSLTASSNVKKPTKYQMFINNEIAILKLQYPMLTAQQIRAKAVEKWKATKINEKRLKGVLKRPGHNRKSAVLKSVSFNSEVYFEDGTSSNSLRRVNDNGTSRRRLENRKSPGKSPIFASKSNYDEVRRSIIYFSPKKDESPKEYEPVSKFPKLRNRNCTWSYKTDKFRPSSSRSNDSDESGEEAEVGGASNDSWEFEPPSSNDSPEYEPPSKIVKVDRKTEDNRAKTSSAKIERDANEVMKELEQLWLDIDHPLDKLGTQFELIEEAKVLGWKPTPFTEENTAWVPDDIKNSYGWQLMINNDF